MKLKERKNLKEKKKERIKTHREKKIQTYHARCRCQGKDESCSCSGSSHAQTIILAITVWHAAVEDKSITEWHWLYPGTDGKTVDKIIAYRLQTGRNGDKAICRSPKHRNGALQRFFFYVSTNQL